MGGPRPPKPRGRYTDLLSAVLSRIPVHTPEWTNYNDSDPGVTLLQVFAFVTESLLGRANLIPERIRRQSMQYIIRAQILGLALLAVAGLIVVGSLNGPGKKLVTTPAPFQLQTELDQITGTTASPRAAATPITPTAPVSISGGEGPGVPPASACGDGVCDPASENRDVCEADCPCVDDLVCGVGETGQCRDCITPQANPSDGGEDGGGRNRGDDGGGITRDQPECPCVCTPTDSCSSGACFICRDCNGSVCEP